MDKDRVSAQIFRTNFAPVLLLSLQYFDPSYFENLLVISRLHPAISKHASSTRMHPSLRSVFWLPIRNWKRAFVVLWIGTTKLPLDRNPFEALLRSVHCNCPANKKLKLGENMPIAVLSIVQLRKVRILFASFGIMDIGGLSLYEKIVFFRCCWRSVG